VDSAHTRAWFLATRPTTLVAHLRADSLEHGLPIGHLQRGDPIVRESRRPQLHGAPESIHDLGGRRRLDIGIHSLHHSTRPSKQHHRARSANYFSSCGLSRGHAILSFRSVNVEWEVVHGYQIRPSRS